MKKLLLPGGDGKFSRVVDTEITVIIIIIITHQLYVMYILSELKKKIKNYFIVFFLCYRSTQSTTVSKLFYCFSKKSTVKVQSI